VEHREVIIDDVRLSYLTAGSGPPLVVLPGWSQAASQFVPVAQRLARARRVLILDHRGQGESEDPGRGFRVHRLAADLHGVLAQEQLEQVSLLGHSMGVAVIYAYLDLFGEERVERLVVSDQRPALVHQAAWTNEEALDSGAALTPEGLVQFHDHLAGPDGEAVFADAMRGMVSRDLEPARFQALLDQTPMERGARADVYWSMASTDLRDVIRSIRKPTLVVTGEASMVPRRSQEWVAQTVPGARLAVIPAANGGSHFAHYENPAAYADVVEPFLEP
jgi:pimeloyl-ACP methyl ester carboxylesterase